MTELAKPVAKRLQRPSWRDSRLLVGVLLVLVAATLGAKAVSGADDRVPVWAAAGDLVAGDQLTAESVRRVDVLLDDDMGAYLAADAAPAPGTYLLRDVRAGELMPRSALGRGSELGVQLVTVRADAVSSTGLARGSRVDVFVTPRTTAATDAKATTTKVLEGAAVAAVQTSGGGFGTSATTSVQLYVPTAKVQQVVEAVDSEAKLTLVPVVGGGPEPGPESGPDAGTGPAPGPGTSPPSTGRADDAGGAGATAPGSGS